MVTPFTCTRGIYTTDGFKQVPCELSQAEIVHIANFTFYRVDQYQPIHSTTNFLDRSLAEQMCQDLATLGYYLGTIHQVETDQGPEPRFEVRLSLTF